MPLTLSDVLCTGQYGAVKAAVTRGDTVTVIGDGAVGLSPIPAAKRLGAEQIILMGGQPPPGLGHDRARGGAGSRGQRRGGMPMTGIAPTPGEATMAPLAGAGPAT